MIISLPWPPAACHPNARSRTWHKRAAANRAYRRDCTYAALADGAQKAPRADQYRVRVEFRPPSNRPLRNIDGAIASIKAGIDALAAVLGVDDSRLIIAWPETFANPVKGGAVIVEIEPAEGAA